MAVSKKVAEKKSPPKKAPPAAKVPGPAELAAELGDAAVVWSAVVATVEGLVPCQLEWRPAKTLRFGRYAILRHKVRTLVYLLPHPGAVEVRIMLGERAFGLAMEAKLPARIKKLAQEAKVYPEGHYIGIAETAPGDIAGIVSLLKCKLAPK